MRLAKTSSISAKFEILTCKNFSFHGNLNDRNNMAESALSTAIEEGERMKNGSLKSLFNSSEAQPTRSKRRPLETIFRCCGDQRNDK